MTVGRTLAIVAALSIYLVSFVTAPLLPPMTAWFSGAFAVLIVSTVAWWPYIGRRSTLTPGAQDGR